MHKAVAQLIKDTMGKAEKQAPLKKLVFKAKFDTKSAKTKALKS